MFNIETVAQDMFNAVKGELANDWKQIKDTVQDLVNDSKANLEKLAQQRINHQITDDDLQDQLADEKDIWQADLDALKIIAEADAQKAINAAFKVLEDAITEAIKVL